MNPAEELGRLFVKFWTGKMTPLEKAALEESMKTYRRVLRRMLREQRELDQDLDLELEGFDDDEEEETAS